MGTVSCLLFLVVCVAASQAHLHGALRFPEDANKGSRIISGYPADDKQFPHQAFLYMSSGISGASCGGSLISDSWVLTAAHCLLGMKTVEVSLGSIDKSRPQVKITSRDFTIHSEYNPSTLNNDIALINLGKSVALSDSIKPIRLPRRSQLDVTHAGETVTVSGWGATDDAGSSPQKLNFVRLSAISNQKCAEYYGDSLIVPSTICCLGLENSSQGTCFGDSGGPLIREDTDGILNQVGVVSFVASVGCSAGFPSGYVRVVHFLDWINSVSGISIRP